MEKKKLAGRVWVAGHQGFVGQALVRQLREEGCSLITVERSQLDLRDKGAVLRFLQEQQPDLVINAAAKVGGIKANNESPATFFYDNLQISTNIIDGAYQVKVPSLVNLGSSCFYPRESAQPITESALLTGPLEPTNEGYALAKISAAKMCDFYRIQYGCDFSSAVPTNLYGPGDHFDPLRSHVIPAMISKFHQAKAAGEESVCFWGTGFPLRQFLHVTDAVAGLIYWLKHRKNADMVNIAGGEEVTIKQLAEKIATVVGYRGRIDFDSSHPDGMPRKSLCGAKLEQLGWQPQVSFDDGLREVYADFLATECS